MPLQFCASTGIRSGKDKKIPIGKDSDQGYTGRLPDRCILLLK